MDSESGQSLPRASGSRSRHVLTIAKLLIGGLLIYYIIDAGGIDFERLGDVLLKPGPLLLSVAVLSVLTLCIGLRWHILVTTQGLNVSLRDLFSLTMIGNFFNSFMPGAVGGDLVKAWYIAAREPGRRTQAVLSLLLDRLLGMTVMIMFGGIALLVCFLRVGLTGKLMTLATAVWAYCAAALVFGGLFFLSARWRLFSIEPLLAPLRRSRTLDKLLQAVFLYRDHPKAIIRAALLSCFYVPAICLLWFFHARTMGISVPLFYLFLVLPVGMTVSAVPLLPGGLGVGQIAFYTLFGWVGANPVDGTTLFTLVQIHIFVFNSFGAFFYLRYRKPDDLTPIP